MTFSDPFGLLALLGIPAVVALHLLRRRSQRLIVPHLGAWSFLDVEVRGSRISKFRLTWLLLLDVIVAALIGLAAAGPLVRLPIGEQTARHLILLIDDSLSMNAQDIAPSRFAAAKVQASALIAEAGPGDIISIVTFGGVPRLVSDSRADPLPLLLDRTARLEAVKASVALSAGLALCESLVQPDLHPEIHIITDAAFGPEATAESPFPLEWHLLGRSNNNQAVLSVVLQTDASRLTRVFTQIANFGTQAATRMITLETEAGLVESGTVELQPGNALVQVWDLVLRPQWAAVRLIGQDDLPDDDVRYASLAAEQQLRVGLVAKDPALLQRALGALPALEISTIAPAEYRYGMPFDLVVFEQYLPQEWPPGDVLIVDPPIDSLLLPVRDPQPAVGFPQWQKTSLLRGVDPTTVRWGSIAVLEEGQQDWDVELGVGDSPVVLTGVSGSSRLTLVLATLSEGNIREHPFLPLLLSNLVDMARGPSVDQTIGLGEPIPFPSPDLYPIIRLVTPSGLAEEYSALLPDRAPTAREVGLYRAELIDPEGQVRTLYYAVSAGGDPESDIRPRDHEALSEQPSPTTPETGNIPFSLRVPLLALACVVLLLEAWLAWR